MSTSRLGATLCHKVHTLHYISYFGVAQVQDC